MRRTMVSPLISSQIKNGLPSAAGELSAIRMGGTGAPAAAAAAWTRASSSIPACTSSGGPMRRINDRRPRSSPSVTASNAHVLRLAPPVSARRLSTATLAPSTRPNNKARRSCRVILGSFLTELEQSLGHPPNLDFLGALGDPVAAVMAIDVFERLVAAVAETAEDLHGAVGRVAHQPVGPVVRPRHFVGDLHVVVAVQVPGRVIDQQTDHLGLGLQLGQRPLHGLVDR